jgi:hypothetical protein
MTSVARQTASYVESVLASAPELSDKQAAAITAAFTAVRGFGASAGLADGTDSDRDVIHSRYRRFKPPLRDDHGSRASLCSGPSSIGDVAVVPEEVLSPTTRVVAA